jgi:hypothetical protein
MADGAQENEQVRKRLCVSFALLSALGTFAEPIIPKQPIQLFNGTDLAGLSTFLLDTKREDPRRVFQVTNGTIRITGDGAGYVATQREYRNYELVVEFKWGVRTSALRRGKARDSGIFLHATGPDGNSHDGDGAFMAAIECNLFQGATGDLLLIRGTNASGRLIAPRITAFVSEERDEERWRRCRSSGQSETIERWGRLNWINKAPDWKDELDFRGPLDVENPSGEWNEIRCICDKNTIRITLNGQFVNGVWAVWPQSGKILLQCEGSEIFFRKFELRPLSPSSKRK